MALTSHRRDTESNLGPFASFYGWNYPEASFIFASVSNTEEFTRCFNIRCLFCFFFRSVLFSTSPRSFFRLNHVRKAWN